MGKIYQINTKYTKRSSNLLNGCKMDQMSIKIYQHLPLQDPPKITQILIFGLKMYRLATRVVWRQVRLKGMTHSS
jgi:hypothetical protein